MPEEANTYPAAMINITNRCTLRCRHCFVFRDGNPNDPSEEMETETMLARIAQLQTRHSIETMLWMGGEPLLRPDVLVEGTKLFRQNTITTNGTLDLIDLPGSLYVVSIDGPPEVNDAVRGKGSFDKVMKTLSRVPGSFQTTITGQCVVSKFNEMCLEETVEILHRSRIDTMTFSFYTPTKEDKSDLAWGSLERRDRAVREALRLKSQYPAFIRNRTRALELTLSENAKSVTDNCLSKKLLLPLYLDRNAFVTPFCCYGNDVNCDLCGGWVVFDLAARFERSDPNRLKGLMFPSNADL